MALCFFGLKFLKREQHLRAVDHRRAAAHQDRDPDRFQDILIGSPGLQRIVHVAAKLEGPPDVSRARAAGPAAPAPDDDDSRDSYGDGGTGA